MARVCHVWEVMSCLKQCHNNSLLVYQMVKISYLEDVHNMSYLGNGHNMSYLGNVHGMSCLEGVHNMSCL